MIAAVCGTIAVCGLAAPALAQDLSDATVGELIREMGSVKLWVLLILCGLITLVLWLGDFLRPGSIQRSGLRDVSSLPSILWILGGASVFLSLSMAVDFAAGLPWLAGPTEGSMRAIATSQSVGYVIAGVLGISLIYLMIKSAPKAGLGFGSADLALGVLAFALAYPFLELTASLMLAMHEGITGTQPAEIAHSTLSLIVDNQNSGWAWLLIFAVVMLVPIVEEVVFRGFLQSGLLKWTKAPIWSIVITSVVFAGLHWTPHAVMSDSTVVALGQALPWVSQVEGGTAPGAPYYALVPLFVLSLAIGLAYERTRKLGVAITMHAIFNGLNVAIALS